VENFGQFSRIDRLDARRSMQSCWVLQFLPRLAKAIRQQFIYLSPIIYILEIITSDLLRKKKSLVCRALVRYVVERLARSKSWRNKKACK
jgi:hypothetical protein